MSIFAGDYPDSPEYLCHECGESSYRISHCIFCRALVCHSWCRRIHRRRECPEEDDGVDELCFRCYPKPKLRWPGLIDVLPRKEYTLAIEERYCARSE